MFTITKDLICDGAEDSCVGTIVKEMPLFVLEQMFGESGEIPNEGKEVAFRLYDDDDELYYEGKLTDDDDCENQSAALRWGETMAGCTTIRVKRGYKWVQEIA